MIRSEKQHQAAKKQLASLREALAQKTQTKAPEVLVRAAQGQTAELAGEIERQIKDYIANRSQQFHSPRFPTPARALGPARTPAREPTRRST